MEVRKVDDNIWEIPKEGKMKVPARVFASEKLLQKMKQDRTLEQARNIAVMPGIYKYGAVMPDGHEGYGFPIGGVAALDYNEGGISPGANGYDINCGVRLLQTTLSKEEVYPKIKELLEQLFQHVPAGLGGSNITVRMQEFNEVLEKGSEWAFENGYGFKEDLENCEENGRIKTADSSEISNRAKKRGHKQLATLGSGNHFIEVQHIEEIFDEKAAKVFGLEKGQVTVLIHTGSRGLGHQTCSDYLREMENKLPEIVKSLPDKELIYAPAHHELAEKYFKAMSAAANFAWCNRHIIAHQVRQAFGKVFDGIELKQVYDVAHNLAKVETHKVDEGKKRVYVHRKGATRAFPKGHEEIPEKYQSVGQPVFIPGSMGTSSYVLCGGEKSMELTFGSTAHGAGRAMSRHAALKQWRGQELKKKLEEQKIYIKSASMKGIAEEAPGAYKNVDEVVDVSHALGIGRKVARLKPIGVVKG